MCRRRVGGGQARGRAASSCDGCTPRSIAASRQRACRSRLDADGRSPRDREAAADRGGGDRRACAATGIAVAVAIGGGDCRSIASVPHAEHSSKAELLKRYDSTPSGEALRQEDSRTIRPDGRQWRRRAPNFREHTAADDEMPVSAATGSAQARRAAGNPSQRALCTWRADAGAMVGSRAARKHRRVTGLDMNRTQPEFPSHDPRAERSRVRARQPQAGDGRARRSVREAVIPASGARYTNASQLDRRRLRALDGARMEDLASLMATDRLGRVVQFDRGRRGAEQSRPTTRRPVSMGDVLPLYRTVTSTASVEDCSHWWALEINAVKAMKDAISCSSCTSTSRATTSASVRAATSIGSGRGADYPCSAS